VLVPHTTEENARSLILSVAWNLRHSDHPNIANVYTNPDLTHTEAKLAYDKRVRQRQRKAEKQHLRENQWLKWKCRGGGTVISGFGPSWWLWAPYCRFWTTLPLLVVAVPETTELTSLSGNQAFTFTSSTWILSRKKVKLCKNSMHSTLKCGRLLAYRSVPCVFWKFEVRERLGLKIGGRGTAFSCILWHFNHW